MTHTLEFQHGKEEDNAQARPAERDRGPTEQHGKNAARGPFIKQGLEAESNRVARNSRRFMAVSRPSSAPLAQATLRQGTQLDGSPARWGDQVKPVQRRNGSGEFPSVDRCHPRGVVLRRTETATRYEPSQ